MENFEKIYRAYFQDVFLYLRRLTGDEHLAEELTSETFFRAMRRLPAFRGDCETRVWLCQIGKHIFFDHCRRQKKLLRLEDVPDWDPASPAPDEAVERSYDAMLLHRHLHGLPEPYKEVFSLRVFGELSFQEIGDLFSRSANWACVTYHRARGKIRERMEEEK